MRAYEADHRADLGATEQLVGHDDATHAEAHANAELLHVGDGDPPGARGKLLREDLRRHRRLAVRRQQHAGRRGEVTHPGMIVRERRIADHRQRQRQVAGKEAPTLRADVGDLQRRAGKRIALGPGVERFGKDRVKVHHGFVSENIVANAGLEPARRHFAQRGHGFGACGERVRTARSKNAA